MAHRLTLELSAGGRGQADSWQPAPSAEPSRYRGDYLMKPGTKLERRPAAAATRPKADMTVERGWKRAEERVRIEFRPALWLLLAAEVVSLWLGRPRLGKGALLGLAWRFLPRKLKFAAGGAAAVAVVLLAGSVAALILAVSQLA